MNPLRRLGKRVADAALQLTLPLFEAAPARPALSRIGNHLVALNGQFVEFSLKRSKRRTIGFMIDDRGLSVTAPRWVPHAEIEAALQERADWILRKTVEWRDRAVRREELSLRWEDGASLPFLGRSVTMRVDPAHRGSAALRGDVLHVGLPAQAGAEQLRDLVQGWLQGQARTHFAQRLEHYRQEHGLAPTRWRLSSARTRWGSCGSDGAIRLNWRLMHFPPDIIDYVICHELAHLRELNHGPQFWHAVEDLFPDYERARGWLRGQTEHATD